MKLTFFSLFHFCWKTISEDLSEKLLLLKLISLINGKIHFTNILRLSSFKLQDTKFKCMFT